jgi:hypothetical protein
MTNAVDLAQTGTISSSWRNRIINGGMTISQRTAVNTAVAVTTTASGTFGPDRFWGFSGTASLWNISQVSTGAYDFPYACRTQRIAGQTSTNAIYCGQTIETLNISGLVGQAVTLSFYATAGANYSGGAATVQILTGTTANQGTLSLNTGAWTSIATPLNSTFTPTTTRTQFTFTVTLGDTVQEIAFRFNWSGSGTAGANDYIDITGVQLEAGSAASPFDYRDYGCELIMCQRYFAKLGGAGSSGYMAVGMGIGRSGTLYAGYIKFPVSMRAAPTLAVSGAMAMMYSGDNWVNISTIASTYGGYDSTMFQGAVASSVLSAGMSLMITQNASSAAFISMSSEL